MPTVADILSPASSAADVLTKALAAHPLANVPLVKGACRCAKPHTGPKAHCKTTKSADEVSIDGGAGGHDFPDGSFENTINMVRTPAVRAVPCPGSEYGESIDGQYHYPTIQGTYGDHVIVGCDACDRFWKVPYSVTENDGRASVMVGEPEARIRAFLAPNAAVDALNDPPFQADEDDSLPDGSQNVTPQDAGTITAD
jgi:hypothetical protein